MMFAGFVDAGRRLTEKLQLVQHNTMVQVKHNKRCVSSKKDAKDEKKVGCFENNNSYKSV